MRENGSKYNYSLINAAQHGLEGPPARPSLEGSIPGTAALCTLSMCACNQLNLVFVQVYQNCGFKCTSRAGLLRTTGDLDRLQTSPPE